MMQNLAYITLEFVYDGLNLYMMEVISGKLQQISYAICEFKNAKNGTV